MRIGGYIPLSLIDYPGTPAAVIFTQGCNWRCRYCHNSQLIPIKSDAPAYDEEQIVSTLAKRAKLIQGVVITGGEPTLQPDLLSFIEKIKTFGFKVKLDTNGTNPDLLEKITREKRVDFIAMDIKANWQKYHDIVCCSTDLERIKRSIQLIASSHIDHQFRTTFDTSILEEDDLEDIKEFLPPSSPYVVQTCRYVD